MDYPPEEVLEKIRSWAITAPHPSKFSFDELIDILQDHWECWDDKWLTGKNIKKLELHTFGWSGNEDILEALMDTMFWCLFWQRTNRGGHYYLRINMKLLKDMVEAYAMPEKKGE